MSEISHAIVLPDRDFAQWLDAVRPYVQHFERVAVLRSPAGNDLNRFRNITAVQTPNVWLNDNALNHIRRIYPQVVRVDVVTANTPNDLRNILQMRVNMNDRYGTFNNNPPHIFDRFVLEYPSPARPARILRPFSSPSDDDPDTHEGVDIYAPAGTPVYASAAGYVVTVITSNDWLNYGPYVMVRTDFGDIDYFVTYGNLRAINVALGQRVEIGDLLGTAAGPAVKLVLQQANGGSMDFRIPNVVDPTLFIYFSGMRVRPNVSGLFIRSLPSAFGIQLGLATPADWLEVREPHGRALAKLGVDGEWLRIDRAGLERAAYCAAWYLEAFSRFDPTEAIPGVNVPGMNLDIDHPRGRPNPTQMRNLGWVRLVYNVSLNPNFPEGDARRYGNVDLNFTFNRYLPFLQALRDAGLNIILVLTHQTFGEGQGYNWEQMTSSRWRSFTGRFADIMRQVAGQFRGRNLIYTYQIWNEQDTNPANIRSAVPMPPQDYAYLLGETIQAMRQGDPTARIITGGHVSGAAAGPVYARTTLNNLPSYLYPNGIAFHPYGKGPLGSPFTIFGSLDDSIRAWSSILPDKPLWITEWGVLDQQNNDGLAPQVAQYAQGFLDIATENFPGIVAAACWYAWADGMDNGFGLVNESNNPKEPLYSAYLGL